MVRPLQSPGFMRISALSSLLVLGVLAAPARADRKDLVKPTAADGPTRRIAAITAPIAAAGRTEPPGTSLTTGDLRLTGAGRPSHPQPFLEAREIAAEVHPYAPEIERCYLERLGDVRRAGRLDLTLVIGRDGDVVSLAAAAPGLPARTARQVESCIREAVSALHFPERRSDTTAVVPYYFQHTYAPGAGPQLSCWNPRGC